MLPRLALDVQIGLSHFNDLKRYRAAQLARDHGPEVAVRHCERCVWADEIVRGRLRLGWNSGCRIGRLNGAFDPDFVSELAEGVVVVEVGGDLEDDFRGQGVHALAEGLCDRVV